MKTMTADSILIPLVRTAGGLVTSLLLAFTGDLAARVFNLLTGFSLDLVVHQNVNFVAIGLGAGFGAFLGWLNPSFPKYWVFGSLLMILLAAIGGAYAARILGPGVDTSYWWGRFATDTTVYLGASTAGLFLATSLGLISQVMLANRFRGPGRS